MTNRPQHRFGTAAQRPTASKQIAGTVWTSTDTGDESVCTGTTWLDTTPGTSVVLRGADDVRVETLRSWASPTLLSALAGGPASNWVACDFSPCGRFLAYGVAASPFVVIYDILNNTFTKLADPATLPAGGAYAVKWSPCGKYLAATSSAAPKLNVWIRRGGTFTACTLTTAAPSGSAPAGYAVVFGLAWHPSSRFLCFGASGSPYLKIYEFTNETTLDVIPDPASMPQSSSIGCDFSPCGRFLAVSNDDGTAPATTRWLTIYEITGRTFTKLPDPAVMPTSAYPRGVTFSPDGKYLAIGCLSTAPKTLIIYERSGTTFTALPDVATMPTSVYYAKFSPDSKYLAVADQSSPYLHIYENVAGTWTRMADPASMPTVNTRSVAWHPTQRFLATSQQSSPYNMVYETAGTTPAGPTNFIEVQD